jgi:hypothetical protein
MNRQLINLSSSITTIFMYHSMTWKLNCQVDIHGPHNNIENEFLDNINIHIHYYGK